MADGRSATLTRVAGVGSTTIVSAVVQVLLTPLVASRAGLAGLATFGVVAATGLVVTMVDAGSEQAILVADPHDHESLRRLTASLALINLVLGLTAAALVMAYLGFAFNPGPTARSTVVEFGAYVMAGSILNLQTLIVRSRLLKADRLHGIAWIDPLVGALFLVAVITFARGDVVLRVTGLALLVRQALIYLLTAIAARRASGRLFGAWSRSVRHAIAPHTPILVSNVFGTTLQISDRLLVGALGDYRMVAALEVGGRLVWAMRVLPVALLTIGNQQLSGLHAGDADRVVTSRASERLFWRTGGITLLSGLTALALGVPFFAAVVADLERAEMLRVVPLALLAGALVLVSSSCTIELRSRGLARIEARRTVIAFVLAGSAAGVAFYAESVPWVLASIWGIPAIVWTTLVVQFFQSGRVVRGPSRRELKAMGVAVTATAVAWFVTGFEANGSGLIVYLAVGGLIAAASAAMFLLEPRTTCVSVRIGDRRSSAR